MKISGFTFLRNGVLLGYPFEESIRSVLPICDEFVIALGESSDGTRERIEAIGSDKIRIIDTRWNEAMQDRGYVYAQQKMIAQFNCSGDWAFYLEGDEVLHEQDLETIRATMERHLDDSEVEALVFDYHHFYGSPDWVAISPGWYRRAPRIIRNTIRNYSPDGLFFVVMDKNKQGRYPKAAMAGTPIYHYGHVRSAARMREKIQQVSRYWGHEPPKFETYSIDPQAVRPFEGSHPAVVQPWLAAEAEKHFAPDPSHQPTRKERKHRLAMKLEGWFNMELSKKHYRLVRK
ncbi:MAG: glycosyltransferase [Gammaproteobacteria bacterium (ex Lamellibrachia satsuma)]|nr:MAG: glycosyltransferase [Gammaproteobacteria bacterium (ex Lamellibrachia satsuma)]RRS33338.1 MAG: glycosyltransferase [Gammaproteobacteria bacterium (ex Lamellibrachia satsuma)]RRS36657.1 MAG: glycosyltransferase [Gammaproteobacteria bacterium (ex Lamellibrachia satsuma)]